MVARTAIPVGKNSSSGPLRLSWRQQNFALRLGLRTENNDENCLFLDNTTPIEVVNLEKCPVFVWFDEVDYVYGRKDLEVDTPAGLYSSATENNVFLFVTRKDRVCLILRPE